MCAWTYPLPLPPPPPHPTPHPTPHHPPTPGPALALALALAVNLTMTELPRTALRPPRVDGWTRTPSPLLSLVDSGSAQIKQTSWKGERAGKTMLCLYDYYQRQRQHQRQHQRLRRCCCRDVWKPTPTRAKAVPNPRAVGGLARYGSGSGSGSGSLTVVMVVVHHMVCGSGRENRRGVRVEVKGGVWIVP